MAVSQAKFSPLFSRQHPGGVQTIAGIDQAPGDVFFVDSTSAGKGATTGHGRSVHTPFSTLAYAFSSDQMGSGDVCYVMPGHAESLAAAGAIAMDIAGVRVVGLVDGSARPTFTWTAADATWTISGANCSLENVLCTTSGTIDVTAAILVTGAGVSIVDMEARESAATSQFVDFLGFGTGAARGTVRNFKFKGAAGDATASAVQVTAVVADFRIENAWLVGTFAAAGLETTAANTDMLARGVYVEQKHATTDAGVTLHASTTGLLIDCFVKSATHDANGFNNALVGAGAAWFNAAVANNAGEQGGTPFTVSAAT